MLEVAVLQLHVSNGDLSVLEGLVNEAITIVLNDPLLGLESVSVLHLLHQFRIHVHSSKSRNDRDVAEDLARLAVLPAGLITVQTYLQVGIDSCVEHAAVDAAVVLVGLELGEVGYSSPRSLGCG